MPKRKMLRQGLGKKVSRRRTLHLLLKKGYIRSSCRTVVYKARDVIWKLMTKRSWGEFPQKKTLDLCVEAAISVCSKYNHGSYGFMDEYLANKGFSFKEFCIMEVAILECCEWKMGGATLFEEMCLRWDKSDDFTLTQLAVMDHCFYEGSLHSIPDAKNEAETVAGMLKKPTLIPVEIKGWEMVARPLLRTREFPPYYDYLDAVWAGQY
jgi:hypothetical protein